MRDSLFKIFELAGIELIHVKVAAEEEALSDSEGALEELLEAWVTLNQFLNLPGVQLIEVEVTAEEQTLSDLEGALDESFEAELSANEFEFVVAKFTSCEAFNETPFEEGLVVEA